MRLSRLSGAGAAVLATLVLSACADHYLAVDGAGHHTAEPPSVTPPSPPPAPGSLMAMAGDTCGAAKLQYLVGKPKSEAPVPVDPSGRRVYCSTCTITMDYRPARLDIVFDTATGLVTAVKCG